jgi:hypothetical protein
MYRRFNFSSLLSYPDHLGSPIVNFEITENENTPSFWHLILIVLWIGISY